MLLVIDITAPFLAFAIALRCLDVSKYLKWFIWLVALLGFLIPVYVHLVDAGFIHFASAATSLGILGGMMFRGRGGWD
jgi:hypothetical protein